MVIKLPQSQLVELKKYSRTRSGTVMHRERERKMKNKKQVQYPCRNCIYFNTCGENTRTEYCAGRMTKAEKKAEDKRNRKEK